MANTWDDIVRRARNGTFLFERAYMDYHANRFTDASLLFVDDAGKIMGILPANICKDNGRIVAHGGLTYGDILPLPTTGLTDVRDMWRVAARHYLAQGMHDIVIKPIPHIYHRYPTDDSLYWLFRAKAQLVSRGASGTIDLQCTATREALWHRKIKRQATAELTLHEGDGGRLEQFWAIVEWVLRTRHATRPVHTATEMNLLMGRFPEHIHLFTVDNAEGEVITGALCFVTETTVHVQYMEAGEEARHRRALDWLMARLIPHFADMGLHYLDFGISTENSGYALNEGLAYQKEGFGGRTVCYDAYLADLTHLSVL